jgi:hypothetical protein
MFKKDLLLSQTGKSPNERLKNTDMITIYCGIVQGLLDLYYD